VDTSTALKCRLVADIGQRELPSPYRPASTPDQYTHHGFFPSLFKETDLLCVLLVDPRFLAGRDLSGAECPLYVHLQRLLNCYIFTS